MLLAFCKIDAQNPIYYANIEGDIDLGLAPYVRRVIKKKKKNFASAIIFRIIHSAEGLMPLLRLKTQS